MASTKPLKDAKPSGPPRLVPRPTAASAARAARNATNRNLAVVSSQRQSPTRTSPSNATCKFKQQRSVTKTDSKIDLKASIPAEDQYLIPDNSISNVAPEELLEQNDYTVEVPHLEGVKENEVFESKLEDSVKQMQNEIQKAARVPDKPSSRPPTPSLSCRPQTPRSLPSSRPQTPRKPSRPTTPAPPVQRHGTPVSRPNTPQRAPTRPTTPSSARVLSPSTQAKEDMMQEDVKNVFIMKQKQFHRMKKELDLKQQAILEVFDTLRDLRDRMSREGVSDCGEGHLNELVLFNVADWTTEEVAQLCRDSVASSAVDGAVEVINTSVPIDEHAWAELDAKVMDVPACFADLCLQAFTARQELIDWIKELIKTNDLKENNGGGECLDRIAFYNAQGLKMCDALRELKNRADGVVDTISQLSRRACRERSTLVAVGETLVRDLARLRQDLEAQDKVLKEIREVRTGNDTSKALEEVRKELEEEKVTNTMAKDKLATTEQQLRQSRARINKMDRQLREAEASIANLTGTVKSLEDQSRQREVQLEARARKLKESLKTGEVTSGQLVQQRDMLQAEVAQLNAQIEAMTAQHKAAIQELTNQLKEMKSSYEDQCKITVKEKELKEAAEAAWRESQNFIEELKTKIMALENSRPNPDIPTEREMDLWAELQATKDTLRITEEEVTACKREKVRFIESLTKIAESENKVVMQHKLAAELLSKEEIVGKMQIQIRDLTKNYKLNEQKVIQYEQYVRELQAHNRAVANCQESPNGISYQDLQQEIMTLKMNMLEAVHQNEELSEMLVQKEQQLEQQDKTSRAQARVIKVREELINMLKKKETEQSRELTALQQDLEHRMKIVDEVNKQIAAKADEIQELFATLEKKQQQTHRLEKIVVALEEQQRRSQAQRTRHEEKIAALEHEIATGGNRRERKFFIW